MVIKLKILFVHLSWLGLLSGRSVNVSAGILKICECVGLTSFPLTARMRASEMAKCSYGTDPPPEWPDLRANTRAGPAWHGNNCVGCARNHTSGQAVPRIAASSHKDARNPEDHDADAPLSS